MDKIARERKFYITEVCPKAIELGMLLRIRKRQGTPEREGLKNWLMCLADVAQPHGKGVSGSDS